MKPYVSKGKLKGETGGAQSERGNRENQKEEC